MIITHFSISTVDVFIVLNVHLPSLTSVLHYGNLFNMYTVVCSWMFNLLLGGIKESDCGSFSTGTFDDELIPSVIL